MSYYVTTPNGMTLRAVPNQRPVPMPGLDDMTVVSVPCAACGQPRPRFEYALTCHPDHPTNTRPDERGLDWDSPDLSRLGPAQALLTARLCRRCAIVAESARLAPVPFAAPVADPVADELRRLKAILEPKPPAPADPPIEGAKFALGRVFISPTTSLLVGSGLTEERSVHNESYRRAVGEEFIRSTLIPRHARGDMGANGQIDKGDKAKAAKCPPLAAWQDQAALALATGNGTIFSDFAVPTIYAQYVERSEPHPIRVWTELASGEARTLVHAGRDGVNLDQ